MRFIRYFFICLLVLFACMQFRAQEQTRGFGTVTPPAAATKSGRTVALVVGVSDYPFVTPLNYAAEDALLMYDFLQSSAGGNVSPADIRLLVNEEATLQNVWGRGLSWIENTVKPAQGDRVIIYLAGHGDAISSDEAFFLCHNVNPAGDKNNYNVTGALDIGKLKNRIAKFSSAGAEVVLIMDACRSGDLPGVRTGITNPFESVVERKAGETLMLSAGANQLAVEDRRWGRGHGIFTWYLVQGLSGKADENADGTVDFFELEQYTKSKVRKETQQMGRMQVPQFAASPSGMGWQGKADKKFLSKLETESIGAVNVSESIALARSTAESSWFTDSTLYAGFNELKKLVRAGKYLGEGSAEPIYTQLAAKFSADQLEPVRVYYMSALAGAGFEAINQELMLEIGSTHTTKFYERRLNYLVKAKRLQRISGEVNQLDNYQKLAEAIFIKKKSESEFKWQLNYSDGLIDTLTSMREQFIGCAAYYFWMSYLRLDPWSKHQPQFENEGNFKAWYSVDNRLRDSTFKLAPDWPKILENQINMMGSYEFTDSFGDKLMRKVEMDSTSAENWYLLSLYFKKHKPYDAIRSYRCLMKSCILAPNFKIADQLFSLECSEVQEQFFEQWQMQEALRNYYNLEFIESDWQQFKIIASKLLHSQVSDEISHEGGLYYFIRYGVEHSKNHELLELFSSADSLSNLGLADLTLLSSIASDEDAYISFFTKLEAKLERYYSSDSWRNYWGIFSDVKAEILAQRIKEIKDFNSLEHILIQAQTKLHERVQELNNSAISDEYLYYRANNYINDSSILVSESFVDSLLELCHRNLSHSYFMTYFKLIQSRKMMDRQLNLYSDIYLRQIDWNNRWGMSDSIPYFQLEAIIFCEQEDTLSLLTSLNYCFDKYHDSFIDVINYLSPDCRRLILGKVLSSSKTSESAFNIYVESGLFSEAKRIYDESRGRESFSSLTWRLNLIKLFIQLKDFASAAKELEQFIEYDIDNSGVFYFEVGYSKNFGPYDAFIQSKEYKAMMARVYTSPEK